MSRARNQQIPTAADDPVPVMLPHVAITVTRDGTMTVTVDGQPYEPEGFAPPWRREDFAKILDGLTDQRRTAVRVEVREADGTVFTDIIAAASHRRAAPETGNATASGAALRGEGFEPGEEVAVAVVVACGDAAPDGTMRGLVTAEQVAASPTGEVILLGRASGTVTVGQPW